MSEGELAAVFEGLAEDAGEAGGEIAESIAKFTDDTANIEDANVARTLAADAETARAANAIGGHPEEIADVPNGSQLAFTEQSPADPDGLLRDYSANDGSRGGPELDRTMSNVRRVIDRYGIEINEGAWIKIDRGLRGLRAMTLPDRTIRLAPEAFENEEQLARTIYHENWHVGQINRYGRYFSGAAEADRWEQEAWDAERQWWSNHPLNPARLGGSS
jgi:hypothetical protein